MWHPSAAATGGDDEMEMDEDDEYSPTEEDVEHEEELEPTMMQNAARWDHFFALVESISRPWPQGEEDTDEYRKARAVEVFNLGAQCANDILALKPTILTWVPHILWSSFCAAADGLPRRSNPALGRRVRVLRRHGEEGDQAYNVPPPPLDRSTPTCVQEVGQDLEANLSLWVH